ncbi:MAG: glycoside hydrolase family 9 protein [Tidjanibacter sp.]|nr:glycoside hydrolase family 9 protein [Tidjanibacter sp.]
MKKRTIIAAMAVLLVGCSTPPAETTYTSNFRHNALGFLPTAEKQMTINLPDAEEFRVRRADNDKVVYEGTLGEVLTQKDVNESVRIADFSELTREGKYYLEIPGVGRSRDFTIGQQAYNDAYATAMRAFYLWRCGTAIDHTYKGIRYQQEICHQGDGHEDHIGIEGGHHDGTGGWHDAGDYGKYVVNAGITGFTLLWAWEQFAPALQNVTLGLPETAPGYPEFLKEIKWEIDWLLKMAYPDGSGKVSHKLTALNFSDFYTMPQEDLQNRYYTDWSSAATADYVALLAQASRAFAPYDAEYAAKCLEAAKVSYDFLSSYTGQKFLMQPQFTTGAYFTIDPDDRMWAAAEMWETTGDERYLKEFEKMAEQQKFVVDVNWDWDNMRNLGMFRYAVSQRPGKNPEVEAKIKENIIAAADEIVATADADVYGRPLGGRYYWGCNGTVGRQTLGLQVADILAPDAKYQAAALDAVAHLFGRNHYDRSYVTGIGFNPPLYPHDRRSAADGIQQPWPGYVVGGGHTATDWIDDQDSYSHNEVAINWQAGLVFALAWFVG